MGLGYALQCSKCDYEETFFTGVGFTCYEVEEKVIKGIKAGMYGKELQSFYVEHPGSKVRAFKEVYHCENCDNLKLKEHIQIYTNYGFYEKIYRCGKCKKESMKLVTAETMNELFCPKCHENLMLNETIFWD